MNMSESDYIKFSISGKLISGPSAFRKIYQIFENFKESKNQEILLDFDEVEWMDANLCAILDSVIFVLNRDNGHKFFIEKKHIEGKFEIFKRNGFLSEATPNEVLIDNKDTTVKMTRFSTDSDGEFYGYIGESLFNHQAFERMPDIKASLMEHFVEVYANIQTHANTIGPVFACGQYYPMLNQLKFTLVDIGVGFLDPISQFTKGHVNTAKDAIIWALVEKNTTKQDAPGGLGLTYLKNYCEKNKHGFQIVTNGKCWTNDSSELNFWSIADFPGTAINLTFNCK
jgi:hypothetical protein